MALAAAAIFAGPGVTGCADSHPDARAATPSAPPVQLAVLGDSLAFGSGAGDTSGGFAFRLYRAIDATRPGSEITNVAIGGSTAADVLRLQVARLKGHRFDVVILCVGGNDVVREIPSTAFARNYRRLVAAVRAAAPTAALVAVGVPDVSISPLFADHAAEVRRLSQADDRAARETAVAAGGRYVDLFSLTRIARDMPGFLSQDRFHPSDEGHARIAALALPIVEAALAAERKARIVRDNGHPR
ncbi:MAG: SGNH/GDSL hydrolase family protein [Candidatus Velthaea sp.]|jgi:lysophospholipase L1-like esterase